MPKADCSELAKAILDLAMNIAAEEEVRDIDDVVSEIQKSFPVMDRTAIIEAIVDASTSEAREVSELAKKLARIKREARTDDALRDKITQLETYLEEGELPDEAMPRKLGPLSIEQLRKTSKNLRKWLTTADPNMQKTLQARLDKLDAQIASGDILMNRASEARLHEQLQGIQDQINIARRHIQDAKAIKKLMDQINALETHLAEGTLPEAKHRAPRGIGPIDVLRDIRDDLRKRLAQSEPAQKKRLEDTIASLEARIKAGDFAPRKRQAELPQSKELAQLIYHRDRLRRDIRIATLELRPKTFWTRLAEPFNAVRAIKTSFDLSAVFRQGGFITLGHPIRAAKAIPDMIRALLSEEESARINARILEGENAPLYARYRLYLAPIDGTERLTRMEEAFMSRLAERVPGVRASERAYLTFLNKLRADSFDTMSVMLAKQGEPTQQEYEAIATFINEATGRGTIGIENAAVALNTIFFAPKYTASRFQLLLFHPLWSKTSGGGPRGGSMAVRKLVAMEYARYLTGLGTVLSLGLLAGGSIEPDPRSSDFLKIRFGNSRIDPLSGLSQVTVLIGRLATGETKSAAGRLTDIRGEDVPYGGSTASDVVWRFLRGKLSPTFGIPLDVLTGKNVVGEKVTLPHAVLTAPVPLSLQDIYEAMKENGVPGGTALGLLSIFGMGLQSYQPKMYRKSHKPGYIRRTK